MEKTIKIGEKEVRLTNNVGWALVYRDQFGRDILPSLMPMLAAALDIVSGYLNATENLSEIGVADVLKITDGDALLEAVTHLSGLEFVELVNITWAMAKAADDSLPDPKTWVRQFDSFPVDEIAPELAKLAFKGLVSSKNLKRLETLKSKVKGIQPTSTLTQSSSQHSSEA